MNHTISQWTARTEHDLPAKQPFHVLVVEDDPDTCANLSDILELDGCRVTAVGTARQALNRNDWSDISTIILDRRLPDAEADTLLPHLRELAPHTPVIVVTGYADLGGAISALRHSAADYILKPIDPNVLRASIARLAEKQRLENELSRSQAQLREQRDFVDHLLETIPTAVLLLDVHGNIVRFNAYFEQLTGFRLEDVRGAEFLPVFVPERDRPTVHSALSSLISRLGISEFETSINGQAGQQLRMRWSATTLRSVNGQISIVASGQDITELKQTQERMLQNERLAAIGETMTGLIHESRNALQRCRACLEMLALELVDRSHALNLVERIQNAQDDLHQLFEEVREYAAPIQLNRQPSNLAEIWHEAWHDLSQLSQEKNLRLAESMERVNLSCLVDRFALKQVFRNIFENAVHASPKDEQISIAVDTIKLNRAEAYRIEIKDHGPGIPAEFRPRILEPFFTTKAKGTGLGLAIAQRIVQSHGGQITVGNEVQFGTTILISLPRGPK